MPILNRLLHIYAVTFTLILTFGALFSGFAWQNVLATLLFLPVTLYFCYHLIKDRYIRRLRRLYLLAHPAPVDRHTVIRSVLSPPNPVPAVFRFDTFLTQKSPTFLATIGLYSLVVVVMLFKATLSYLPKPPFLSPIPKNELSITK